MAEAHQEAGVKQKTRLSKKELKRRKQKNFQLRHKFGIGVGDFDKILAFQSGVCAICKSPSKEENRSLHVDHCHKTGEIRGLLCTRCNLVLGGMRDSVTFAKQFVEYLRNPPVRTLTRRKGGKGSHRVPKLCHRRDGRAYATDNLTRRQVVFGKWGTLEAEAAYQEWLVIHMAKLDMACRQHALKRRLSASVNNPGPCSETDEKEQDKEFTNGDIQTDPHTQVVLPEGWPALLHGSEASQADLFQDAAGI